MHAERIENICNDIHATIERVVILELLDDRDAPLSRAELARHVSGSKCEPIDIDPAIDGLYAAGLVHVCGELVQATLAARRIDQLYPLSI
ncbi:MAG TPA: hypothetical protein VGO29_09770 [Solirubrobacteraceae bacterium]|jgi:hypothetical protein|nr:hypothetical protein [Solirubrobacteraceae bacterium]